MYSHSRRKQKTGGRRREREREKKRERGKRSWMSLLIRALILSDQGTIQTTSFDLNYLLISPMHKHSQIHMKLQHMKFGRNQFSP